MLAQDIFLKLARGIAIELEHHGVEREHIGGRNLLRAGGGRPRNRLHVGRQVVRSCTGSQPGEHYEADYSSRGAALWEQMS